MKRRADYFDFESKLIRNRTILHRFQQGLKAPRLQLLRASALQAAIARIQLGPAWSDSEHALWRLLELDLGARFSE